MQISIIIPVYNAEKHISKTVDSIIEQRAEDIEIILIDDGSIDNSGAICDKYGETYNNVKVIHQENAGPSVARNRGVKEAQGLYISFVDADDQFESHWYSVVSSLIIQNKPDLIITGYNRVGSHGRSQNHSEFRVRVDENGKCLGETGEIVESLIKQSRFNPIWNKVYLLKTIKDNNLLFDTKYRLGEDLLFNLAYFKCAKNIIITNERLYDYTLNTNGLTRTYIIDKFEKLLSVTLEFKKSINEFNIPLNLYYDRLLRNIYSSIMELYHQDCTFLETEKMDCTRRIIENPAVMELTSSYQPKSFLKRVLVHILKTENLKFLLFTCRYMKIVKFGNKKSY